MLERLQVLARRLEAWRPLLFVLAAFGLVLGVYVLITANDLADDAALIPAFMLFTWATLARSFISIFVYVPVSANSDSSVWFRFKRWLVRGVYWALFILLTVASAFLLLSTWQLFGVWRELY